MNKPNDFRPLSGASNPHLQTLLPRVISKRLRFTPHWQRLVLPDDDFVDLAWTEPPEQALTKPRVILFHGLEGSLYSPYAHGLLAAWREQGWLGVIMHFRGCSGEPNRGRRMYHSGETSDVAFFINWLASTYPKAPTAAVGVSLGGNILANYLAQSQQNSSLVCAMTISAPFQLAPCAEHIRHGFYRFYEYYLLASLKRSVKRKLQRYPDSLPLTIEQVNPIETLIDFDDQITAPVHGFASAMDYYQRCSALPYLANITTPLMIIQAKDDPLLTQDVVPDLSILPDTIHYQLTTYGGHVGFVTGSWLKPKMWLEQQSISWLNNYLIGT